MNFSVRLTELNPLFLEYDAMNWTVKFLEYDAKNWTLYFLNMTQWIEQLNFLSLTQRIGPFVQIRRKNWTLFQIWLQEMSIFFKKKKDSQNWFFLNLTHRIEPFFLTLTHRIEFCKKVLNELNSFFLVWLNQLNSLSPDPTQRIEPPLLTRLEELNSFVDYDSTKWTLFLLTQRIEIFSMWFKESFSQQWLKAFYPFKKMTQELNFFEKLWLTEWNPSFQFDSKNWTLFNITQRTEPFSTYDSKNWTFFNRTFSIWLKRLKIFNMTWRIEPFFDMT